MIKHTLLLTLLAINVNAQVGINTQNPSVTLDVKASPTNISIIDGILAPKLTGEQLRAKNDVYGSDQHAAIVFVTEKDPNPQTKTINVLSPGFYYYNSSKEVWEGFSTKIPTPKFEKVVYTNVADPNTPNAPFSISPYYSVNLLTEVCTSPAAFWLPDPLLAANKNYVYIGQSECDTNGDNKEFSAWLYDGVKYIPYDSDNDNTAWYLTPVRSDAMGDKEASIWRPGFLGIGGKGNDSNTLTLYNYTNDRVPTGSYSATLLRSNMIHTKSGILNLYGTYNTISNNANNTSFNEFIGYHSELNNNVDIPVNTFRNLSLKTKNLKGVVADYQGIYNLLENTSTSTTGTARFLIGMTTEVNNFGKVNYGVQKGMVVVNTTSDETDTGHPTESMIGLEVINEMKSRKSGSVGMYRGVKSFFTNSGSVSSTSAVGLDSQMSFTGSGVTGAINGIFNTITNKSTGTTDMNQFNGVNTHMSHESTTSGLRYFRGNNTEMKISGKVAASPTIIGSRNVIDITTGSGHQGGDVKGYSVEINNSGTARISHVAGFEVVNRKTVGGEVADNYGVLVDSQVAAPSVVINNYGVRVKNVEGGSNNYSIHTGTGKVHFGDDVASAGTVKVGTSIASDVAPSAGMIRFKNGIFEGYDGTRWRQLQFAN
ncbi:hypothetical protein [Faecalibacter macacae]|uniref:Uncharacterized protein n=1 Tax=Faecalibacter macacae TaxID=1859289 RepID=A0A3L9M473_9FLAO|nr:hypothetical protein [Faecalibacter macacae]RLZ07805.1 hypothetical protein EAH69_11105 [Faecalibacter macacae]